MQSGIVHVFTELSYQGFKWSLMKSIGVDAMWLWRKDERSERRKIYFLGLYWDDLLIVVFWLRASGTAPLYASLLLLLFCNLEVAEEHLCLLLKICIMLLCS